MEKSTAKSIFLITCIGLFSFGVMWAAIGPLLSEFAAKNGTSLATIGGIYSAIFLGVITSLTALGRHIDRLGLLRTFTIALLVLALGIAGVSFSQWLPLTFVLAFIAGLGHGLVNLCGNVMVGRIYKENSLSALNMVNMFFGVGAFIGPLLVSGSLSLFKSGFPALWLSQAVMFVIGLVLLLGFFNVKIGTQRQTADEPSQKKLRFAGYLWSLAVLVLLYVGAESAMGGWATTYMQKTTSLTIGLAALVTSGFWLALTLGRGMGALLGTRISAKKMLMLCFTIASVGVILFIVGYGQTMISILAIFLVGFGFGAVYPTCMAMVTNAFPENPGQAGSILTLMSAVGGMILPWLQGAIMQQAGIRAGAYLFAVVMVLIISSFVVNQRLEKKSRINLDPSL